MGIEKQTPHDSEQKEVVTPLVGLPEFLRQEQLSGLIPNVPAFISPFALIYDHKTGGIYLDTTTEVEESALSLPPFIESKANLVGVMHVYDETGSHFVVDASGLAPGQIRSEHDLFQEEIPEEHRFAYGNRQTHRSLSAVVFRNLEGELEVHGDPKYFDSARSLCEDFDRALESSADGQQGV